MDNRLVVITPLKALLNTDLKAVMDAASLPPFRFSSMIFSLH